MTLDLTTWTSILGSCLTMIVMVVSFFLKRLLDRLIPQLQKRHHTVKRLLRESVSTLSALSTPRIPQYDSSTHTIPSTPTPVSE
uniref:Uncharacterized protein n=1 Tax=unidentified TaxID=32644 RepID=A0A6G9W2G7_9ZZZZ|nr:hypothetical protein [unidentified]